MGLSNDRINLMPSLFSDELDELEKELLEVERETKRHESEVPDDE